MKNIDMEYVKKLENRVNELEERLERLAGILEHIEEINAEIQKRRFYNK